MSKGLNRLASVRLVAFDVDGVFTDGRFYLSDDGIESKAFHTQDGFGVRQLLNSGIAVAVISGRSSRAVERRMAELEVPYVVLGCKNKVEALDELATSLGISPDDCAYVGDDIPDLALLEYVGFSVAVANAAPALLEYCDYVTKQTGGSGAVREICELVMAAKDSCDG